MSFSYTHEPQLLAPFIKLFLQSSDLFLKQWSLVNLLPLKRFFCPYNKKIDTCPIPGRFVPPTRLEIALWMGMRVIGASDVFFIAIVCFVNLNHILLHVRTLFFGFTHCDEWLKEFGLCAPVKQEVMDGQFHFPRQPGVLKNVNMNGNILQRDSVLLSRLLIIVVNVY